MVISRIPVENGLDFYQKTLIHTPIIKVIDNITGDQDLSDGTPVSITGAFYRKVNSETPDKAGLFGEADAVLLVKIQYSNINKNDKITYTHEGTGVIENFRVHVQPVLRTLQTAQYYKVDLFKI